MADIFVDTSGWGELIDAAQPHNKQADTIYRNAIQRRHRLVTTNYILAELIALLTSPLRVPRSTAVSYVQAIKASVLTVLVHIDPALDEEAWQLLSQRLDKNWSLVDCSSFVIMRHMGLTEALTTDHHFEQAGFIRLLK